MSLPCLSFPLIVSLIFLHDHSCPPPSPTSPPRRSALTEVQSLETVYPRPRSPNPRIHLFLGGRRL
jgi:hypothetical protein